jgi:7-carboxy-7-deazaguanine synthase
MAYAVKEIYYTLQGEGAHAGRPAVFLRFAGCNLWSGHEKDRHKGLGGCSAWCDTDFVGTNGVGGGKFANPSQLANAVWSLWPHNNNSPMRPYVVCTGGEPLLQLDENLLDAFDTLGVDAAAETNGTQESPRGRLWLTVSPKAGAPLQITKGNELKLVYPQDGLAPEQFAGLDFQHFFLQPLDGPHRVRNTEQAIAYCLANPRWRLSIQTHKYIGIA